MSVLAHSDKVLPPILLGVFLYLDMNQVKKMSEFLKFLIYNKNLR